MRRRARGTARASHGGPGPIGRYLTRPASWPTLLAAPSKKHEWRCSRRLLAGTAHPYYLSQAEFQVASSRERATPCAYLAQPYSAILVPLGFHCQFVGLSVSHKTETGDLNSFYEGRHTAEPEVPWVHGYNITLHCRHVHCRVNVLHGAGLAEPCSPSV